MKQTTKRLVIRLNSRLTFSSSSTEICYYTGRSNDVPGLCLADYNHHKASRNHIDALDLLPLDPIEAFGIYHSLKEKLVKGDTIELVQISTVDTFETKTFDEDAEREFLRMKAIKKLSQDEVYALGIENLAVYGKLKYHKVDEE